MLLKVLIELLTSAVLLTEQQGVLRGHRLIQRQAKLRRVDLQLAGQARHVAADRPGDRV